jgi:hypothetical protein
MVKTPKDKKKSDQLTLKALLDGLRMTKSFARLQERRAKKELKGWHARRKNE